MKSYFEGKRQRRIFISITVVLVILISIIAFCGIYVSDYYHADDEAISKFVGDCPMGRRFSTEMLDDGTAVWIPDEAETGFIFYPGGKVEYTAYIPLMDACASEGILCVLVQMPFNLAVLDTNAAEGIQEMYPNIESWYIGGHSLGGSMAATYLSENVDDYDGLILLGSYSTVNLSETTLKVLSIYGSEDRVLNRDKYNDNKENLPDDFTEVEIDGGCHAYFGMYGKQDGDGIPTLTNEEQIKRTVNTISEFIH